MKFPKVAALTLSALLLAGCAPSAQDKALDACAADMVERHGDTLEEGRETCEFMSSVDESFLDYWSEE